MRISTAKKLINSVVYVDVAIVLTLLALKILPLLQRRRFLEEGLWLGLLGGFLSGLSVAGSILLASATRHSSGNIWRSFKLWAVSTFWLFALLSFTCFDFDNYPLCFRILCGVRILSFLVLTHSVEELGSVVHLQKSNCSIGAEQDIKARRWAKLCLRMITYQDSVLTLVLFLSVPQILGSPPLTLFWSFVGFIVPLLAVTGLEESISIREGWTQSALRVAIWLSVNVLLVLLYTSFRHSSSRSPVKAVALLIDRVVTTAFVINSIQKGYRTRKIVSLDESALNGESLIGEPSPTLTIVANHVYSNGAGHCEDAGSRNGIIPLLTDLEHAPPSRGTGEFVHFGGDQVRPRSVTPGLPAVRGNINRVTIGRSMSSDSLPTYESVVDEILEQGVSDREEPSETPPPTYLETTIVPEF